MVTSRKNLAGQIMKRKTLKLLMTLTSLGLFSSIVIAKNVGEVDFKISCSDKSQQTFNHAMALAHNMMYIQATKYFESIAKEEHSCAMANWGLAFTQIHPLWSDKLTKEEFEKGIALLSKAKEQTNTSTLEKGFIDALSAFYINDESSSDQQRFQKWEKAQRKILDQYPDNPEAISLYALTMLATAPKTDKTFKYQKEAGELLEQLHKKHPKHPAGFHYTIHAYDNPVLAAKGEYYARNYDAIAPEVPHALHMPTHIFVRLGYWPETISWNLRSAEAARKQPLPDGSFSMHYAHALDYLMYAYLQQGNYKAAKETLDKVNEVDKIQPIFASGYGIAAARARFYLEQKKWDEAAKLPLKQPDSYAWDKYPGAYAITVFARGMGHLQTGNTKATEEAIKQLDQIYNNLKSNNDAYWSTLTDSKRHTLQAWLAVKQGDTSNALAIMEKAADIEDSVDKHPVTPSEVLPARELYGEMLLQTNRPAQALQAFEASLKINPNRFNSLLGAAIAADRSNNAKLGDEYRNKARAIRKQAKK